MESFWNSSYLKVNNLHDINEQKVRQMLPVIVMLAIVMAMGSIGNPLVIYFFGIRLPARTSHLFITALAIYDFILSSVGIILAIEYHILHIYKFDDVPLCKLSNYLIYFLSSASGLIVLTVAVERYRKISLRIKTSTRKARIIIVLITCVSAICSSPSLIFFKVSKINLTEDTDITGSMCTIFLTKDDKVPNTAYHLGLSFVFLLIFSTIIILYCLVHKEMRSGRAGSSSRYTFVMISISISYVLSYLPYLCVEIWRTIEEDSVRYILPVSNNVALEIISRFFYINCAVNPIIYGFLNAGFKQFILSLIRKIFCRKSTLESSMEVNCDPQDQERRGLLR